MKEILAYPPVDFTRPFDTLRNEEIDIYFHYDSRIGAPTCKAACSHCYFRNRPTFNIPVEQALQITQNLRNQGYNVGMVPADSFSDDALNAGDLGSAFRLKSIGASAWTSGMPLYLPGWKERLTRAWQIGFRSIIISAHEAAGTSVPIKGVTKPLVIRQAIQNIGEWNTLLRISEPTPDQPGYSIATTFTIRKDNCDLSTMRQMAHWAISAGVNVARFNCFANFQRLPEHKVYELSREDISQFYGHLAVLQEEFMSTPLQFGISEDWGDAGIEQILPYLPSNWMSKQTGWCRAGYRLFSMIMVEDEVVLTGCVDKWAPILGKLVSDLGGYRIEWSTEHIEAIRTAVQNQGVYACWGGVGYDREPQAGFNSNPTAELTIFKE